MVALSFNIVFFLKELENRELMTTEPCVLFAVTVNHWLCLEVTLAAAVGQKVGCKLRFGLGFFL